MLAASPRPTVKRVRAVARPRFAVAAAAVASLALPGLALGTDGVAPLAGRLVHARPIVAMPTRTRGVALVVRTSPDDLAAVVARLRRDGVRASLATADAPTPAQHDAARDSGDDVIPDLRRGGLLSWIPTGKRLDGRAGNDASAAPQFFLAPAGGPSTGQLLLARAGHWRAVVGSIAAGDGGRLQRLPRRGDVLVTVVDGSAGSLRALDAAVSSVIRSGATPVPLSVLAASSQAITAGARVKQAPAPTSAATPAPSTAPWKAVDPSASPKSIGAQPTGMSV